LGDKAFSRERVEIFGDSAACVIDNFKTLTYSRNGKRQSLGNPLLAGVDRGHRAEMQALVTALTTGKAFPVSFVTYANTTRATFAALESVRSGNSQLLA
jgi:hypothetical protein